MSTNVTANLINQASNKRNLALKSMFLIAKLYCFCKASSGLEICLLDWLQAGLIRWVSGNQELHGDASLVALDLIDPP